ncbi:hypothetical protein [Rhizobacter sp. Root16D2]|nr:hypothetical protein [Rhizobacter sp. Root16D2]
MKPEPKTLAVEAVSANDPLKTLRATPSAPYRQISRALRGVPPAS